MSTDQFIFLAFYFTIFVGLLNSVKVVYSISHLNKRLKSLVGDKSHKINYPNIFIIVPALRESAIIENSIDNFLKLKYPEGKLKIIIVTTEREYDIPQNDTNTIRTVKRKIESLNGQPGSQRLLHIHYPYVKGIKSDQLNYAVNELLTKFPAEFKENTYIGIYDADSSPEKNVLELLAKEGSLNGWPDAFQQPTLYFKNHAFENVLAGSFSILQTAYAFYYENYNFLTQPKGSNKMLYFIGHGLFVRWPTLKEVGLFPTPIEDTRLGHIFSYLNKEVRIIPSFDVVETTPNLSERIKQSSVWFVGESYFWKDYKIAKKIGRVNILRSLRLGVYKFYRNAIWMFRGPALLSLAIVSGYKIGGSAPIIILAYYLILPAFIVVLSLKNLKLSWTKISFSLLLSPAEFLLMSFGPNLGLIKILTSRPSEEKVLFPKTERKREYYQKFKNIFAHSSVPWQQDIIKKLLKRAGATNSYKVADIGSGIGNNVVSIAEFTEQITVLDTSSDALGILKERYADKIKELRIIQADASKIPLVSESFDLIILTETLEHCERPEEVLAECLRILKKGGNIIVSTPNYLNLAGIWKKVWDSTHTNLTWDAWGNHKEGTENFFTSFKLKRMFGDKKVEIIEDLGGDAIRSWLPFLKRYYNFIDKHPFLAAGRVWPIKYFLMNYFILGEKV